MKSYIRKGQVPRASLTVTEIGWKFAYFTEVTRTCRHCCSCGLLDEPVGHGLAGGRARVAMGSGQRDSILATQLSAIRGQECE